MEIATKIQDEGSGKEKTTWSKRVENADGSSIETTVEKVSNGFIKTVCTSGNSDNGYNYETIKSIHQDNPMEEKSIADKLEEFLKNK